MNNTLSILTEDKDIDKQVYFVFSSTLTKIGSIIRVLTHNRYNHVSVAFDPNLTEMYSYARHKAAAPLDGGFVQETPLRFTLNKQKDIYIKLCAVSLSEDEYIKVREYIDHLKRNQADCLYNLFAAVLHPLHKGIDIKDSYSCVGFAAQLLMISGFLDSDRKNYEYTISNLESILNPNKIYEGKLSEYKHSGEWREETFFEPDSFYIITLKSLKHFLRLVYKAFIKSR